MQDTINGAKPSSASQILANSKDQFNILFSNMLRFDDEDMALFDSCYADIFGDGTPGFSFMGATFYAQFAAEMFLGLLSSNPLRKAVIAALDEEKARKLPGAYWEESMLSNRFGIAGRDYTGDMRDLMGMMNDSYDKIYTLNIWYGTPDGRKEFETYCLSRKAAKMLKRIIVEFPYLLRRYDFDEQFAGEIMEYTGIVAAQIREASKDA